MTEPNQIRVRFAPSPTGYLHIGGARTALFNYLFARKHGGVFVLRIEDTDRERSTPEAVQAILDGMRFLGLEWDEGPEVGGEYGPYFQSERSEVYSALVDRLLDAGRAYPCFCSRERLAELRAEQEKAKAPRLYDRRCRDLDPEDVERRKSAGEPHVVRFAVESAGEAVVDDMIRGRVTVANADIEDFIVQRADGTCVYNLAVVGDDSGMAITHVIRGDDHLTNTSKQVLLFEALDLPVPRYAHMPLIHGPGGQKLSKRHGAVSVTEYEENGYLPEAMINFLVRMGWSFDDREEIFSMSDLHEKFDISGISKSPAVYDLKRLDHLGNYYIRQRPIEELVELAIPRLAKAGLIQDNDAPNASERERLTRMVALEQERMDYLAQIAEKLRFYFEDPDVYEAKAAKILLKQPENAPGPADFLPDFAGALERGFSEDPKALEEIGRQFSESSGVSMKNLCQPIRAIVTGRSFSPPLFDIIAIVGKDTTTRRLREAPAVIERLKAERREQSEKPA